MRAKRILSVFLITLVFGVTALFGTSDVMARTNRNALKAKREQQRCAEAEANGDEKLMAWCAKRNWGRYSGKSAGECANAVDTAAASIQCATSPETCTDAGSVMAMLEDYLSGSPSFGPVYVKDCQVNIKGAAQTTASNGVAIAQQLAAAAQAQRDAEERARIAQEQQNELDRIAAQSAADTQKDIEVAQAEAEINKAANNPNAERDETVKNILAYHANIGSAPEVLLAGACTNNLQLDLSLTMDKANSKTMYACYPESQYVKVRTTAAAQTSSGGGFQIGGFDMGGILEGVTGGGGLDLESMLGQFTGATGQTAAAVDASQVPELVKEFDKKAVSSDAKVLYEDAVSNLVDTYPQALAAISQNMAAEVQTISSLRNYIQSFNDPSATLQAIEYAEKTALGYAQQAESFIKSASYSKTRVSPYYFIMGTAYYRAAKEALDEVVNVLSINSYNAQDCVARDCKIYADNKMEKSFQECVNRCAQGGNRVAGTWDEKTFIYANDSAFNAFYGLAALVQKNALCTARSEAEKTAALNGRKDQYNYMWGQSVSDSDGAYKGIKDLMSTLISASNFSETDSANLKRIFDTVTRDTNLAVMGLQDFMDNIRGMYNTYYNGLSAYFKTKARARVQEALTKLEGAYAMTCPSGYYTYTSTVATAPAGGDDGNTNGGGAPVEVGDRGGNVDQETAAKRKMCADIMGPTIAAKSGRDLDDCEKLHESEISLFAKEIVEGECKLFVNKQTGGNSLNIHPLCYADSCMRSGYDKFVGYFNSSSASSGIEKLDDAVKAGGHESCAPNTAPNPFLNPSTPSLQNIKSCTDWVKDNYGDTSLDTYDNTPCYVEHCEAKGNSDAYEKMFNGIVIDGVKIRNKSDKMWEMLKIDGVQDACRAKDRSKWR